MTTRDAFPTYLCSDGVRRTLAELRAASRQAWYSARAAAHVGFKVYKRWAGTPDEKLVHVTALVDGPQRFRDWGDEIYMGHVYPWDFVREARPCRPTA